MPDLWQVFPDVHDHFDVTVLATTIEAIEGKALATGASSNSIRNELLSAIEARYLE